jgi:UDP:flavonoid glycosyltransferase YjiC (YdhE family)
MRVLVTSTAGTGHVHPIVPLLRALRDGGHDVTWAIAPQACATIVQFGIPAVPAGLDRHEARGASEKRRELMVKIMAAQPRQRHLFAHPGFASRLAPAMLDDLIVVCDQLVPDVIVHEPNEYAAAPIATARGIPHVTVGFGGPTPDEVLAAAEDALRRLWARLGLDLRPAAGMYDHLYLHPLPPSLGPRLARRAMQPMQPIGFDGATDQNAPPWLDALGRSRPCVYVTFGTEVTQFAPIRDVLAALASLNVDAVLTVGEAMNPALFETRPANVRIEQYIPQRFVLARSSLLVSHAGSGAMLGAASRGIPQLCLPIAADQFENADFVSAAGIGVTVEPHQIDPTTLRRAIKRLLDDHAFTRRAHGVAEEIAAMPPPASHVGTIEQLGR